MQHRNKLISLYNKYLHNIHTANLFEQHYIYSQFFIHFCEMCGIDFEVCFRSSSVRVRGTLWFGACIVRGACYVVQCAWQERCGAVCVARVVWWGVN